MGEPLVFVDQELWHECREGDLPKLLSKYTRNNVNQRTDIFALGNPKLPDISLQHSSIILHPIGGPENSLRPCKYHKHLSSL